MEMLAHVHYEQDMRYAVSLAESEAQAYGENLVSEAERYRRAQFPVRLMEKEITRVKKAVNQVAGLPQRVRRRIADRAVIDKSWIRSPQTEDAFQVLLDLHRTYSTRFHEQGVINEARRKRETLSAYEVNTRTQLRMSRLAVLREWSPSEDFSSEDAYESDIDTGTATCRDSENHSSTGAREPAKN